MILPYQRYKNISGKVLQMELRLSESFNFTPGETIKLLHREQAHYNSGMVDGYEFYALDYCGAYDCYYTGWISETFLKEHFELQPYPVFKNQNAMFHWIYEDRPHKSQLTGRDLLHKGHMEWYKQFLHVLNKGQYTKWKLNPENILLGLPEEHEHQERYAYFNEVHLELKSEYNQLFK